MTSPTALLLESTNGRAPAVDLRAALLAGQAPDRGLYIPRTFPKLAANDIAAFRDLPYPEVAFRVVREYTQGVLDDDALKAICYDAYNFPVPLEHVEDRTFILRLDRGPTASFKDFAARLMGRLIGRFVREDAANASGTSGGPGAQPPLTILTATSGDTGSAVAAAFHGVEGIQVVVLFPKDEVTARQRIQMTTLGGNIRAIAIDGKFDDCQAMVKRAFADPALAHLRLSSANSINIGRLLPQSVYYFYAASRIAEPGEPVVIAVPSGNFGNMMGAVIAGRMGLAIKRLVVPVNANDEVPSFLQSEHYKKIEPSRNCLSNAMNVGHPSNLARLVAVYGGQMDETGALAKAPDFEAMRRDLFSVSVTDDDTRATIKSAWDQFKLLLEPHGAVGWHGLMAYAETEPLTGVPAFAVETAHPAKFPEEIERVLGITPEVPDSLAALENKPERCDQLPADYEAFKSDLLKLQSR